MCFHFDSALDEAKIELRRQFELSRHEKDPKVIDDRICDIDDAVCLNFCCL